MESSASVTPDGNFENCPTCGATIPLNAPEALCPKCLGAAAVVRDEVPSNEGEGIGEGIGEWIGRYRLLEKIGEGGFGVVYMAEQREPVTRKVALKIIKLGMDTKQVIARFEAERQALALMDHLNIARVLDAGTTQSGRPYFVMELVRGVPITKFCDENRLSTRERLGIFKDVCAAVQHAHQKGIIHRDLKPNNVLVTMNDDKPIPKVIDFGIAKATAHRLTDLTLFTQHHQFVGTPAYMSPEQAQMNNKDVDTRSDIYALGVLLYELLTGKTPFDTAALMAKGQEAVFRAIQEEEPPRPSTRLSCLTNQERSDTAGFRREAPEKLRGQLKGDLDWVVMKALEKDRIRRYDTATSLASDVQHHLAGEPVSAVPPSALYTFQKLVRRNRLAFVASAAVVSALIIGLTLALWSFSRERVAKGLAEEQREAADQQREVAEANEARARQLQYTADMRMTELALANLNPGLAKSILDSHVPKKSERDLRGWEWRYLRGQLRDDSLVSNRDSREPGRSLSVSPDGTHLAIGRTWGSIEILDAYSLKRLRILQEESGQTGCVAFSPKGDLLAATGMSGVIHLWDTSTWTKRSSLDVHKDIRALAYSPDGKHLAVFCLGGRARVLSVATGDIEQEHSGFGTFYAGLSFSPDGNYLGIGGHNGRIVVIDLAEKKIAWEAKAIEEGVGSLAFSPDGSVLAAGGWGTGLITLWNTKSEECVGKLHGHASHVEGMTFVDDGKILVSASYDHTVRVWNLESQKTTAILDGSLGRLSRVAAARDGDDVITTAFDGTVARWRLTRPPSLNGPILHPGIARFVSFTGEGSELIGTTEDGRVVIADGYDPVSIKSVERLGEGNFHMVWCAEKGLLAVTSKANSIRVWSRERDDLISLPFDPGEQTLKFLNGGDLLLAVAYQEEGPHKVAAWDTQTWERADERALSWRRILDDFHKQILPRYNDVDAITVSPDERLLGIGTWGGGVAWYDLNDSRHLAIERVHLGYVAGLVFTKDGMTAASNSGGVALWDIGDPSPRLHATIQASHGLLGSPSFSPDGSRLAARDGDDGVTIWDVATQRQLLTLPCQFAAHRPDTTFVPDGNGILAEGEAGLHVWRVPTLAEIDLDNSLNP